MKPTPEFEFPPEQQHARGKAKKLEWLTIGYLLTVTVIMYLAMGSSQAMKTAWLEDMLSLIPPITFLIAARIADWRPTLRFPYGYHRVTSIAFLCSSLALFTMGTFLCLDGLYQLVTAEHPTIGGITLWGHTFWHGWLMFPALIYSAVPAVFLGRAKLPLARKLHDKVLHADAAMNKADWMTALAAMIGVLGIGLGFWWADAVAAVAISLSILHDGFKNLRQVVFDLMDEAPKTVDAAATDPLPGRVREYLKQLPWVADAKVRLREQGHVYFGEAFVVVSDFAGLVDKLEQATGHFKQLNWRLHDVAIVVVASLDEVES